MIVKCARVTDAGGLEGCSESTADCYGVYEHPWDDVENFVAMFMNYDDAVFFCDKVAERDV